MKHVFIINPAAGRHSSEDIVRSAVGSYFKAHDGEYAIRLTRAPNDATDIAREEASLGGPVRLYACGGDGTLREVATGAFGFANAEVACFPTGSGNDFIRNFGNKKDFLDIPSLINGHAIKADMIDCGKGRLAVNICSCGYDANVAVNLAIYKNIPFVTGTSAYILSCIHTLMQNIKTSFIISIDGHEAFSSDYLLTAFCNGGWYGGGFNVAPKSNISDGMLDFVLIGTVGRLYFLHMVGKFRAGEHENLPVKHLRGHTISIKHNGEFPVSIDGDIIETESISFSVIPGCLNFVLPGNVYGSDI